MRLSMFVMAPVLGLAVVATAAAAPFIPQSDNQVLEQLPFAARDPVMRELRALSDRPKSQPDNLPLALSLARRYLELGRVTGDPRYAGYAQAALAPWWDLPQPPEDVLVLRATLRQRMHLFDAALADLSAALSADPHNVQARLVRATVLQVQGAFDAALGECAALQGQTTPLLSTACLASVNGATGKLGESYALLATALEGQRGAQREVRVWALTILAEMAARAGIKVEADNHFRAALALDDADNYLLGAYADFLLDNGEAERAAALLRDKTRIDPLLLRYALALKAQGSPELAAQVEQLRERFEASRLRGDRVHAREEARFALDLLDDPTAALKLAQENWRVQKEPADVRILLEAALAAGDAASVEVARDWLQQSRLQDQRLDQYLSRSLKPI
jgi:Tfp pilus assembly protein PilF